MAPFSKKTSQYIVTFIVGVKVIAISIICYLALHVYIELEQVIEENVE